MIVWEITNDHFLIFFEKISENNGNIKTSIYAGLVAFCNTFFKCKNQNVLQIHACQTKGYMPTLILIVLYCTVPFYTPN